MTTSQKACMIVYSLVILQGTFTITYLFIKAKKTEVLYSFCLGEVVVILWLFFGMIENMSSTTKQLNLSIRLTLFPICMIGGVWLIFALLYAEIITKKNKSIMILIMAPLIITYLPALTNNYFHLVVAGKDISTPTITHWGICKNINLIMSYAYIIGVLILITYKSISEMKHYKLNLILIFIGVCFPTIISVLALFKVVPEFGFDITPASFSVFFVLLTVAIFRFRFLNVTSFATNEIFYDIEEAVVITDNDNRLEEYNKAFLNEFSDVIGVKKCVSVEMFLDLLGKYAIDMVRFDALKKIVGERHNTIYYDSIEIMIGSRRKKYSFYMKPLKDKKDRVIARTFSFKDSTDFVMSAIRDDRRRIAEDIHDNLNNMVHVITMNLEHANKHIEEKEKSVECIKVAYDTAKGVGITLRYILEELLPVDVEKVGLINALRDLTNKINGYGVKLNFYYDGFENIDAMIGNFNSKYGEVIYKVCMEAINNSHSKGQAKEIDIVLSFKDRILRLYISDNGMGCEEIKKGRGLNGMERKIKALGGKVAFISEFAEGFSIRAEIPVREEQI